MDPEQHSTQVWHIRPCLHQAIDVFESSVQPANAGVRCPSWRTFGPWPEDGPSTVKRELSQLQKSRRDAAALALVEIVRDSALRYKVPTIWLCRTQRPISAVVHLWCAEAGVPWQRGLDGLLGEADYPLLTAAAGRIGRAPLRMCDTRKPCSIAAALNHLMARHSVRVAVCDWTLEGRELIAVRQVAARSALAIICPSRQ
jgi:hypothetical protein